MSIEKKKIHYVFLSRLVPEEIADEYSRATKGIMANAGMLFQNNIIDGIETNIHEEISLINIVPILSYPKCSLKIIENFTFSHKTKKNDINVGFLNFPFLKRLIQKCKLRKILLNNLNDAGDIDKCIIAYTPYPEFVQSFSHVKRKYRNCKIIVIYPDLPEYTNLRKNQNIISKLYTYYSSKVSEKCERYSDGIVVVTEQMCEKITNKRHVVVEGIYNDDIFESEKGNEDTRLKTIFYAGTLNEKFGILRLLNAFLRIESDNYRLVICGVGDSENVIKQKIEVDKRICFLGKVDRLEVKKWINKSSVIVNPRYEHEEYTKYSFPSKNMESLSSGVPFIAYKLAGIPDEYDNYINYPENESEESLTELIKLICEDRSSFYQDRAKRAQSFVCNEKNSAVMGKKIINMIESF